MEEECRMMTSQTCLDEVWCHPFVTDSGIILDIDMSILYIMCTNMKNSLLMVSYLGLMQFYLVQNMG